MNATPIITMPNNRLTHIFFLLLASSLFACAQKPAYKSPAGYELTKPEKYIMPNVLHEISGIAFNKGNSDTVYAEQDEEGRLFYFKLGDQQIDAVKFGKKGDYEDIAICNGTVIMLRSDGVLYTFPLDESIAGKTDNVLELKGLLPDGEYEGMFADEATKTVYVLCKHCGEDKTSKQVSGYSFNLTANNQLVSNGGFSIDVRVIETITQQSKINFHPSALAKSSLGNEWFILSSVNKMLVVTDSAWKVKDVYALDPSVFNQPEGIAFDNEHNLYISNEGGNTGSGNILKFVYKKQ